MPTLVSLIVPTFDRPESLPRAVESCLNQNYANLEVIVHDNGSNPKTAEAIQKFSKDSRFKYFRNSSLVGMYPNWHEAVYSHSSGEWIGIISDDDRLIDRNFVSEAMGRVRQNPKLVLIHGDFVSYERLKDKKIVSSRNLPKEVSGRWYFENFWNQGATFNLVSTLFKRSVGQSFKYFSETGTSSCDWVDFLRLCLYGDVGFINKPVAEYTIHDSNFSRSISLQSHLQNLRKLVEVPSREALQHGYDSAMLGQWSARVAQRYVDSVITLLCENKQRADIPRAVAMFSELYPNVKSSLLRPNNLVKLVIGGTALYSSLKRLI